MTSAPEISIVIPTYREAANLPLLIPRLAAAMSAMGRPYEIIIADDDSRDGTEEVVARLAAAAPVRLVLRTALRDLSLAVLDGFTAAGGELLVVMDADLSHPPENVPDLIARLEQPPTDFVIGSRFVPGGATENWARHRKLNSYVATALARPLSGRIRDPMAGFFALHRTTLNRAERLNPIGYKIGLELICRCRCRHVVEVPIRFPDRTAGHSKLNLEQQARYLIHLDRLYRDYRPVYGLLVRPLLWGMLATTRGLQALRRSSRRNTTQVTAPEAQIIKE